jgi:hypothetical protein
MLEHWNGNLQVPSVRAVAVVAVCYLLLYDDAVSVEVLDCPFISAAMLGDR